MATYEERSFEERRMEFAVPSGEYGACWVEVMKAVSAARQQLVSMGLVEKDREPSDDQIRIKPGDDEVIVFYKVERDLSTGTWRTV